LLLRVTGKVRLYVIKLCKVWTGAGRGMGKLILSVKVLRKRLQGDYPCGSGSGSLFVRLNCNKRDEFGLTFPDERG
jgi:hypothetical protein